MDPVRLGNAYRALRIRRGLRQIDLAGAVRVSRQLISKIETGHLAEIQVGTLRRVAEGLGAALDVYIRWQGESLDRLLDAAHTGLVESIVKLLRGCGWETVVEASFAIEGERGSIDVFAFHPPTATALVVEVKSVVPDSQATIHTTDRKVRLARTVARARGWQATNVARLLVIGDSSAARDRVAALGETYRVAFPMRGRAVHAWLRQPGGAMSGLLFVGFVARGGITNRVTGRKRVRRAAPRPKATPGGAIASEARLASPALP